ncbi:MAG: hypothetical protein KF893_26060, partial [Caldilineaceae bacterium]|nr:hypothetical protein [Caldilineaceae bacterium]
ITKETIRKGILEYQYLDSVSVYYLLPDGKKVGEAEITIDWEKYEVRIKTNGENISLEKGRSLREQISLLYAVFIQHMEKMSNAFGVKERVVRYSYRNSIYRNKQKLEGARSVLGTSPGEPIKWSDRGEKDSDGNDVFSLVTHSEILPELGVKVQSLRRLKK